MNNTTVIRSGDVQVLSAGTGITHSEYNKNTDQAVKFLQIWVVPNQQEAAPRYDQITLKVADRQNKLQQILSPSASDDGVWIHQNAWFHQTQLQAGKELQYTLKEKEKNGVYAFVIDGSVTINGQSLSKRDGFGVWEVDALDIKAKDTTELLLMEVPMEI